MFHRNLWNKAVPEQYRNTSFATPLVLTLCKTWLFESPCSDCNSMNENDFEDVDGVFPNCAACDGSVGRNGAICETCGEGCCGACAVRFMWRCGCCYDSTQCQRCAQERSESCVCCGRWNVCGKCAKRPPRCKWCKTSDIISLELRSGKATDEVMRELKTDGGRICKDCLDHESPEFRFKCDCLDQRFHEGISFRCDRQLVAPRHDDDDPSPRLLHPTSTLWIEIFRFVDASDIHAIRMLGRGMKTQYWDVAHAVFCDPTVRLETRQLVAAHRRYYRLLRYLGSDDASRLFRELREIPNLRTKLRTTVLQPRLYVSVDVPYWQIDHGYHRGE